MMINFMLTKCENLVKLLWIFAFLFMIPILTAGLYIEIFDKYSVFEVDDFKLFACIGVAYLIHFIIYKITSLNFNYNLLFKI